MDRRSAREGTGSVSRHKHSGLNDVYIFLCGLLTSPCKPSALSHRGHPGIAGRARQETARLCEQGFRGSLPSSQGDTLAHPGREGAPSSLLWDGNGARALPQLYSDRPLPLPEGICISFGKPGHVGGRAGRGIALQQEPGLAADVGAWQSSWPNGQWTRAQAGVCWALCVGSAIHTHLFSRTVLQGGTHGSRATAVETEPRETCEGQGYCFAPISPERSTEHVCSEYCGNAHGRNNSGAKVQIQACVAPNPVIVPLHLGK